MAHKEIGEYLKGSRIPRQFVCDTKEDIANLPSAMAGSTAVVPSEGAIYMVNASGRWVEWGE